MVEDWTPAWLGFGAPVAADDVQGTGWGFELQVGLWLVAYGVVFFSNF